MGLVGWYTHCIGGELLLKMVLLKKTVLTKPFGLPVKADVYFSLSTTNTFFDYIYFTVYHLIGPLDDSKNTTVVWCGVFLFDY